MGGGGCSLQPYPPPPQGDTNKPRRVQPARRSHFSTSSRNRDQSTQRLPPTSKQRLNLKMGTTSLCLQSTHFQRAPMSISDRETHPQTQTYGYPSLLSDSGSQFQWDRDQTLPHLLWYPWVFLLVTSLRLHFPALLLSLPSVMSWTSTTPRIFWDGPKPQLPRGTPTPQVSQTIPVSLAGSPSPALLPGPAHKASHLSGTQNKGSPLSPGSPSHTGFRKTHGAPPPPKPSPGALISGPCFVPRAQPVRAQENPEGR